MSNIGVDLSWPGSEPNGADSNCTGIAGRLSGRLSDRDLVDFRVGKYAVCAVAEAPLRIWLARLLLRYGGTAPGTAATLYDCTELLRSRAHRAPQAT
jgi:hypothetical protein